MYVEIFDHIENCSFNFFSLFLKTRFSNTCKAQKEYIMDTIKKTELRELSCLDVLVRAIIMILCLPK